MANLPGGDRTETALPANVCQMDYFCKYSPPRLSFLAVEIADFGWATDRRPDGTPADLFIVTLFAGVWKKKEGACDTGSAGVGF